MSRSLLHDWEPSIENLYVEMNKIAEDIYNTAYARGNYARGKNHSDVTEVLDKIKAEIEEYKSRQLTLAIGVDDLEQGKQIALEYVLAVLDKYRVESEDNE